MEVAIVIEAMQETDLDEVERIEQASFEFPWKRSFFEADLNHEYAHMIVAREAGRLLGYAIAWDAEAELHLANIAVDVEVQRKGIGSLLLSRVIGIGQELTCRRLYLEVRQSDLAAQRFYQQHGFFQTGTRRGYYPDGEDALVLEKEV